LQTAPCGGAKGRQRGGRRRRADEARASVGIKRGGGLLELGEIVGGGETGAAVLAAGGLGQHMDTSMKMFAASEVSTMLLVFVMLVWLADVLSGQLRKVLG
jgi:hypothetical protein